MTRATRTSGGTWSVFPSPRTTCKRCHCRAGSARRGTPEDRRREGRSGRVAPRRSKRSARGRHRRSLCGRRSRLRRTYGRHRRRARHNRRPTRSGSKQRLAPGCLRKAPSDCAHDGVALSRGRLDRERIHRRRWMGSEQPRSPRSAGRIHAGSAPSRKQSGRWRGGRMQRSQSQCAWRADTARVGKFRTSRSRQTRTTNPDIRSKPRGSP